MPRKKRPKLSKEQVAALIVRDRAGEQAARDELFFSCYPLVCKLAADASTFHKIEMEDCQQEGSLGLLRAIDRFEPERELEFSTFAWWLIFGAITDLVKRRDKAKKELEARLALGRCEEAKEFPIDLEPEPEPPAREVAEILAKLHWSTRQILEEAYLRGDTKPTPAIRKALADAMLERRMDE